MSTELVELRARLQTMDYRLARAQNDLIDLAKTKCGTDPLLKSYYRSLKLEMESLRQERNKLRDERNKLVDENASLANVFNLVSQLVYGTNASDGAKISAAVSALEWTATSTEDHKIVNTVNEEKQILSFQVQNPHGFIDQDKGVTKAEPLTPLFLNEKHK
ncbi:unnamed protein product [Angiostrongylus costaricensis]|uniref:GRIP domain-containing protein n=1 Tax=Angiostrongylus costaricensis TaxID=334426 RepID=A0A0R3PIL3_ANGCS|nr:unnamed protein product [Angiostrongylus costaricensis]